ncbi:LIRP-like isoform X2 [Chelonus insularis]|nr:LIRP-like isoform X2 [Chelonus insularis]XP_034937597.1 LIRP-like isoform X2 [Chelonus insularis]XP_034937598.1 LIRP-like isoform X2 [Chelonus insularis]XP_034937602.1 LIRP-like isoform X2 [Chelonus insularis]
MQSTFSRINIIIFLVLVVTLMVAHPTSSQSDIFQYGDKRQDLSGPMHRYCGKQLSNALQILCNGVYNSMFKKSDQEMEIDADYPYPYDYPLRSRASANAMWGRFGGVRFRRESRGVHDECCVKSCSLQELMSYCGN